MNAPTLCHTIILNLKKCIYRLSMTESELALTEQKVNDYNMLITRLKQELSEKMTNHAEDLRRYQEVKNFIVHQK